MDRMVSVKFNELQLLLFQVYDRRNISTDQAADMLGITVGEFVESFDLWESDE